MGGSAGHHCRWAGGAAFGPEAGAHASGLRTVNVGGAFPCWAISMPPEDPFLLADKIVAGPERLGGREMTLLLHGASSVVFENTTAGVQEGAPGSTSLPPAGPNARFAAPLAASGP
jgi:hypothetical protein